MKKHTMAVENYFQNVIKKSWTWARLTEEEQKRFIDMPVFDNIKGSDKTRMEWLHTIYLSFITGLGYKPIGWREEVETQGMGDIMTRDELNKNWFLSEYNEDTDEQLDYYINERKCEIGDKAYLYDHADNELTEMKIIHIIRWTDDANYYNKLVENEDVLLE